MSARLIDLLLPLSSRERGLLGLAALVLVLGLGFGLLLPLQDHRKAAEISLQEARALELWVAERVYEKKALIREMSEKFNTPTQTEPTRAIGPSGVEQALISAHLRPSLSALATSEDEGLDLRFDRVDFIKLTTWLSSNHPSWGYQIDNLRLEVLKDLDGAPEREGKVAAWISLAPQGVDGR